MIRRLPNSHFLCGKARKGCFNDAKHLIGFSQETGRACKGCWMHHFPCIGASAQWNMLTSEWQWTRTFEASSGRIHQLTILRNRLRNEIQLFLHHRILQIITGGFGLWTVSSVSQGCFFSSKLHITYELFIYLAISGWLRCTLCWALWA